MFEDMSPHGAGLACGQSFAIGFGVLKFDCYHDRGEISTLSLIQILLTRQEAEIERTVALMVMGENGNRFNGRQEVKHPDRSTTKPGETPEIRT